MHFRVLAMEQYVRIWVDDGAVVEFDWPERAFDLCVVLLARVLIQD